MDVHNENVFKAQSYRSAAWRLEKSQDPLEHLDLVQLQQLDGVGQSIAAVIHALNVEGEFEVLKKVLDACAKSNVVIEINSHPYRLDLDWRWIGLATQQGIKISVNPDSHQKETWI